MSDSTEQLIELIKQDKRYHKEAYEFVWRALEFAQLKYCADESEYEGEEAESMGPHVTGQQLCEAIRLYALDQFGLTAKSVLDHWGIHSTGDFGEIVYNMIRVGKMGKSDSDRREDFEDVYDFEEGLTRGFKIKMPSLDEGNWA